MRSLRIFCMMGIAAALITPWFAQETEDLAVPIPGSDRVVSFIVDASSAGEYKVIVWTPVDVGEAGFGAKQIHCGLDISVTPSGTATIRKRTKIFSRNGQIGSMHIDQYSSDAAWNIQRGKVSIEVTGIQDCGGFLSAGASLFFQHSINQPTETYLAHQLFTWLVRVFGILGFTGLLLHEILSLQRRKPTNQGTRNI